MALSSGGQRERPLTLLNRLRSPQPGLEAVFMETVAAPSACVPSALLALDGRQLSLGVNGRLVKYRVVVTDFLDDGGRIGLAHRVQRHDHRLLPGQGLQGIDQVVQADGSLLTAGLLVFVDVMKELPATLVMRPFNFDTLATQAYTLATDERLAEASTAALAIVVVGILPLIVISRQIARQRRSA